MTHFRYHHHLLHSEEVALPLLAEHYGTPCYIYSETTLRNNFREFSQPLNKRSHLICYAVKANSNLHILRVFAELGAGFDIVSGGELERVLKSGGDPRKVVFSGVGKTQLEIERALQVGIHCFYVESSGELDRIESIARRLQKKAPIALRVNPNIDAKTHPYIATGLKENKFGVAMEEVIPLYHYAQKSPYLSIEGISCHIGSQLTDLSPFLEALDRLLHLVQQLNSLGIQLHHIDCGGGLGIQYRHETPPKPAEYVQALVNQVQDPTLALFFQPGRVLTANAGILLTRIEYLKDQGEKHFAVVDAGMNDLLRPALYEGWHPIVSVIEHPSGKSCSYDIVGPVCESADFLGKDRLLTAQPGDLLAIGLVGAYGFVMSSQYNSRPRAAEVLVKGAQHRLIRRRETLEQLIENEELE